ncbi:MAG: IS200/IS605 family transposase [Candidatus Kapaibacterium sp.]|nr:IS200/IS605 family transposase [Ignavibacteriota bacterium]MCB9221860.1 IS200/IS605 family transposase [Ignavibacteria bacterium]
MSWVRIWVHIVFSTKNREPLLKDNLRDYVFDHIRQTAKERNIYIKSIDGWEDHCHCLIRLNKDESLNTLVQQIKVESTTWMNKSNLIKGFEWEDDYLAVSVSESNLEKVIHYIDSQSEHHKFKSFDEEYKDFLEYFK